MMNETEESDESDIYTSWDCVGMCMMLALVPLVLAAVFMNPENLWLAMGGMIAVGLSVLVYIVHNVLRWAFIGPVLDTLGVVLALVYTAAAVWLWYLPMGTFNLSPDEAPVEAPVELPAE